MSLVIPAGDVCDPDDDNDGLLDADEPLHGTDPMDPDTDGDTISDGDEVAADTDPRDPNDPPFIPSVPALDGAGLAFLLLLMAAAGWLALSER